MKRLTRIEGINQVLKIKTAERISTENELDTIPQAVEAGVELDRAVENVLTNFQWFWNGVQEGSLITDNNGEATIPDNLTYIRFLRTDAAVSIPWLTTKGGTVYDKFNHTTNLGVSKTIWYEAKLIWDFEDLPLAFQNLAIAEARKELAGGGAHWSPQRLAYETQKYNDSLQAAHKFDNFLSGGHVTNPMTGRRRPNRRDGYLGI